jgi:hypothetical protein
MDVSKIENMGWKHSINLKAGIKRTIEEFQKILLLDPLTNNP